MPLSIGPIEAPRSKNETVVELLSDLILTGRLPKGRLIPPESELCDELGVSRSVLRESMKILQAKGLVRVRQGSGTVVAGPPVAVPTEALRNYLVLGQISLTAILEVRAPIEIEVARLAANRRSPDQLKRLKQTISIMGDAGGDLDLVLTADHAFHGALIEITGNPLFGILNSAMDGYFSRLRSETLRLGPQRIVRQHRAIFEAIANQDPEAAAAAMRQHMDATRSDLAKLHGGGRD